MNVVPGVDDPSEIILQNRGWIFLVINHISLQDSNHLPGITMGAAIRRRPNALNLLRQMRLLKRMSREDVGGLEACNQLIHSDV